MIALLVLLQSIFLNKKTPYTMAYSAQVDYVGKLIQLLVDASVFQIQLQIMGFKINLKHFSAQQ
jgi:hypothetical protein